MDELKNHFRKHEKEMQVETPDEKGLWQRIEEANEKQHRPKRILAVRFAAAASILLAAGLGLWQWKEGSKPHDTPNGNAQNSRPAKGAPAFATDTITRTVPLLTAKGARAKKQRPTAKRPYATKPQPLADDYTQLVNYRLEQLRRTPVYTETPEFFSTFSQQLQQMEKDEAALKTDVQTYGLNNRLVDALITVYREKLRLLKGLQGEIDKMNSAVKKSRTDNRQPPYYLTL